MFSIGYRVDKLELMLYTLTEHKLIQQQQQERTTIMLYIKSYLNGNDKDLVIKEAIDVETQSFIINTKKLKDYIKNNHKEQSIYHLFINYIISKLDLNGEVVYAGETVNVDKDKYNLISYFCPECEEIKHFIPKGTTYIVNENGSTIATIK